MATILIIDDAKTDRELIGSVVLKAGHRPIFASDGAEGIQKAESEKPAMIFLDVVMPGMNGFNACRKLKRSEDTKAIPVVLVTTKNEDSDVFWGKKQGADGHVGKPFTPADLSALISKFVA